MIGSIEGRVLAAVGIALACCVSIAKHQDSTVLVRGGTLSMGTLSSAIPELKRLYNVRFPGVFEDEVPEHSVTLSDFRMDRYEVTNAKFSQFVAARPEWSRTRLPAEMHNGHYLESWQVGSYPAEKANHPVVFVTWQAAQAFCRWAGGRLPSEAEWEYAARGGRESEFPWGEALPSAERANYSASGFGDTRPVGSYPPNPLGLHDMAGNVWEFVLDTWPSAYPAESQADPIAGGDVPDAALRTIRGRRVIRGGSYAGAEVNLRTRWRDSHLVSNAAAFVGFRCVYPPIKRKR